MSKDMDINSVDFSYTCGGCGCGEFLNSAPGNKFHFLKCAPGIFG